MRNRMEPKARTKELVVQELENETLIYDLKTNKAHCLNETSALVWQLCDGTNSINEISDWLSSLLKTDISEEFVWLALKQFSEDGLLEHHANFERVLPDITRRQLIRKVGFASVIALPIVTSLVAPKASIAQSCVSQQGSCTPSTTCCSGNVCVPTFTGFISDGTSGGDRCCVPGGIRDGLTGATFCGSIACTALGAANCCSGIADTAPTANPSCSAGGQNTCACT